MLSTRVPFFAHTGQIPLAVITFFSCGLSFWLTVRACANLAPGHAQLELLVMGATWELAKLTFSIKGAYRIKRGDAAHKASGYRLVGMSLVLAAGSVAASTTFLVQTDHRISQDAAQASHQALRASDAYERDTASLAALDEEIAQLTALAEQYRLKGLVTQGVRALERIQPLRDQRIAQAHALSAQEAATTLSLPATAASFLGEASARWRLAAQCVLALMLEAVGMVALSLLCDEENGAASGACAPPGTPASRVVRLKVAPSRTARGAHPQRLASDAVPANGHATAPPTLLQRVSSAATASRITYDAAPQRRVTDAGAASLRTTSDSSLLRRAPQRGAAGGAGAGPSLAPSLSVLRGGRDAQRLCALYAYAKHLVCSAQVRPCYRELRQALGASQAIVQRFLRALVAEGVLCRIGTRYALVATLDANGGAA